VTSVARVTRSKARARANYDRRSGGYERFEGRFERRARLTGERLLAVTAGEQVLEVGSGPGASLVALARAAGPTGHVIGLDLAPRMHRAAARRIDASGLAGRVSLVVGDGAHLPLRAGSIDAAFTSFTLELFDTPELPVVIDELRRVLRPGGRLVVVSLLSTAPPAPMERAYLLAHRLMPTLADCRPIPIAPLVAAGGLEVLELRRSDLVGIPVGVLLARAP
jgi:ubiquinone/menaquinone biosynthesis C-methylase UbiE